MLNTYNRTKIYNNEIEVPSKIRAASFTNSGLDWNYFIATYIDRDLHSKLLAFDNSLLINFVTILPLITSGYFYTASLVISKTSFDPSLDGVKEWLLKSLNEADDTQEDK